MISRIKRASRHHCAKFRADRSDRCWGNGDFSKWRSSATFDIHNFEILSADTIHMVIDELHHA